MLSLQEGLWEAQRQAQCTFLDARQGGDNTSATVVKAATKSEVAAQGEVKDGPGEEQAVKGESAELMDDPFNLGALLAGTAAPETCGIPSSTCSLVATDYCDPCCGCHATKVQC